MTGNAGKTNNYVVGFAFYILGGGTLEIKKILNNNAAVTFDEKGKETIVMGRGIAYKRKIGDELDPLKIDKTFTLSDKSVSSRFQELLTNIPMEHILLSERIINYAKIKLGKQLNDIIYVTLSDHISGAIQRYKEGSFLKNPMLWDIKRFYKDEFEIGLKANKVVEEETGISFLEDEAAFIALHFVNAELNGDLSNIYDITRIMQEVSDIVKNFFKTEFDENSINYFRFVTHLKFFAQRVLTNSHYNDGNNDLLESIKYKHQKTFQCIQKIKSFIAEKYKYELSDDDMLYLMLHIVRLVKDV